jgi:hypothetical protein
MAIARFQWCDTSHPTIDNAGDFVYSHGRLETASGNYLGQEPQ